ncbi:MAG: sialate O-acetylesterase [Planctomycetota bacterium]|nr:sialate O-acetylesterase [Planctomycetota bacterium]
MRTLLVAVAAWFACAAPAWADVEFASVFGDGMVLQRERAVPIWGRAKPGTRVEVACAGQRKSGRADARGRWRVDLDAMPAGGPHTLQVDGDGSARCEGVLVGDVWICSGQSNMAWPTSASANAKEEMEAAGRWNLRLFTVEVNGADERADAVRGTWMPCSPKTVAAFSAVGYYFGRAVQSAVDVPIGLLCTAVGGTPAEAWMDRDVLAKTRGLKPLAERWDAAIGRYDKTDKKDAMRRSGQRPGTLWNGMVAPLLPFAIRGVIWYQGESNAGRAEQYHTLFPAMIRDWRAQWGQGDFPFVFVQLANFMARQDAPGDSAWAELREAQRLTLAAVPQTGMAVAIDVGDEKDIHPRNKQDVGARLAAWVLAHEYGREVVPSGPLWRTAKRQGKSLVLQFDHAAGLSPRADEPLVGFAVAGKDKRWVWARARIQGETVVLDHPDGDSAHFARYAWADNPACNLVNAAGLPAAPFRTDEFPLTTAGKE